MLYPAETDHCADILGWAMLFMLFMLFMLLLQLGAEYPMGPCHELLTQGLEYCWLMYPDDWPMYPDDAGQDDDDAGHGLVCWEAGPE